MNILVVDDSNLIRNLVKSMLKLKNHEVDTADNGAQALDKYFKFQPDLVILDLSMPIMDGHETLTRLLRQDANAKVIMFSALESREEVASSRMRIGAFFKKARDSAMRCLCPPESFKPPSPISVLYPFGSLQIKS